MKRVRYLVSAVWMMALIQGCASTPHHPKAVAKTSAPLSETVTPARSVIPEYELMAAFKSSVGDKKGHLLKDPSGHFWLQFSGKHDLIELEGMENLSAAKFAIVRGRTYAIIEGRSQGCPMTYEVLRADRAQAQPSRWRLRDCDIRLVPTTSRKALRLSGERFDRSRVVYDIPVDSDPVRTAVAAPVAVKQAKGASPSKAAAQPGKPKKVKWPPQDPNADLDLIKVETVKEEEDDETPTVWKVNP